MDKPNRCKECGHTFYDKCCPNCEVEERVEKKWCECGDERLEEGQDHCYLCAEDRQKEHDDGHGDWLYEQEKDRRMMEE